MNYYHNLQSSLSSPYYIKTFIQLIISSENYSCYRSLGEKYENKKVKLNYMNKRNLEIEADCDMCPLHNKIECRLGVIHKWRHFVDPISPSSRFLLLRPLYCCHRIPPPPYDRDVIYGWTLMNGRLFDRVAIFGGNFKFDCILN